MNFLTILSYVLAVVETASLIATLVYVTRAMHEKKIKRTRRGKKGGKSDDIIQKAVSVYYRNACFFFMLYLILNFVRRYSGIFE